MAIKIRLLNAPPHLKAKWEAEINKKFKRYVDERAALAKAQAELQQARRRDLANEIFKKHP